MNVLDYTDILDAVEDYAVILLDNDGSIRRWNKGAMLIKGYSESEVLGKNISLLYPPSDIASNVPNLILEEARSKGKVLRDCWRLRKNGDRFWGSMLICSLKDEHGKPNGFIEITRDFTQVKQAEDRFQMVVEWAPNAMVLINKEGRITLVNGQTEKLFGFERKELINERVEILIPSRYATGHPAYRNSFFHKPESRPMGIGRDLFALRKDKSEFPVEIGLNPIETPEGPMVLASIIDITERKIHEANRLKSDFLPRMSHELRTPLNAILGFSELLIDDLAGPLNAKQKEYVQDIYAGGKHLLQLINDVLDLTKIEAGKTNLAPGEFSLQRVIRNVMNILSPLSDKKELVITADLSDDVDMVRLDENRINQILYNLISNAIKFNHPRGKIVVTTEKEDRDWLLIKVRDTGIGIAKEDFDKLFIPFVQLDNRVSRLHEGSGLGLSLTKNLVELHGGTITLNSQVDKGSEFIVRLPFHFEKNDAK